MFNYPDSVTIRQVGTPDQQAAGWVDDAEPAARPIALSDPDPDWGSRYSREEARIRQALGRRALTLEHIGSTAVPGLPAKPIIDIDLQVADTEAEHDYLPPLLEAGYRLVLREPWWNGHRMLTTAGEGVNLHVFPTGSPELVRHLLLRDWLRTHPDDRDLYARSKQHLAVQTADAPAAYNLAKNTLLDQIYSRAFREPPQTLAASTRLADLVGRSGSHPGS